MEEPKFTQHRCEVLSPALPDFGPMFERYANDLRRAAERAGP